jgi:purine-binding chemotaxis protein CheW
MERLLSSPTAAKTPAALLVLVVRTGCQICALPLENIVETMRPLATESIADMPPLIRGLAIIRGSPVPVVDLNMLVGTRHDVPIGRFVLLRLGERRAAVAVEQVLGVRRLDGSVLQKFPPLLQDAYSEMVTAIAMRDQELLLILQLSRIVPDEVWQSLEASGAVS